MPTFYTLTARNGRHIGTWPDKSGLVGRAGLKSRYPGSRITTYTGTRAMSEAGLRILQERGIKS